MIFCFVVGQFCKELRYDYNRYCCSAQEGFTKILFSMLMLFISPVHVFTLFPVTALAPVSGVTDGGGGGDVHLLVHHRDHPGK